MEPNSVAEALPALYRAVLDRVAQLEATSQRDLANRIRADAIKIYSRAWDDRARRDLGALLRRHSQSGAARQAPGRSFRRRTIRTA